MASFDTLIEQIVGEKDCAVVLEALKRYEVQSDCALTQRSAVAAAEKAHAHLESESEKWSALNLPLTVRYQLLSEHLLGTQGA